MTNLAFYPEQALEQAGIDPDDFRASGCYALACDRPRDIAAAWKAVYDVPMPDALAQKPRFAYLGWANSLLDRLHDHAAGDVRRVGVLDVCPPVGVAAVWVGAAPERETGLAMEWSREHPQTCVWANGDVF